MESLVNKLKKLALALLFCFLPLTVNAKVTVFTTPLKDLHITTIKGHLYDSTKISKKKSKKDYNDLFARSIDWLEKLHKSEKTFEISKLKNEEAQVILSSVYFISKVESGDYIPNIMPAAIGIWAELGQLVVVVKGKEKWKLEIKKPKKP